MAEVCVESATFNIALIIPAVDFSVTIIESPTKLEEGDKIDITARVTNNGDKRIELREAEIFDGTTSIWKNKPIPSPNIEPNKHRDFVLSTLLTSPKMPGHAATIRVRMCCDFTAW